MQDAGVKGYEIHMGETIGREQPFSGITERNSASVRIEDGAVSANGKIWGTYIHGIFDNDKFRTIFLNNIRVGRGLPEKGVIAFKDKKDYCIKVIAEAVRNGIDLQKLFAIIRPESLEY
jgi:adenosylcobyric acid synthase